MTAIFCDAVEVRINRLGVAGSSGCGCRRGSYGLLVGLLSHHKAGGKVRVGGKREGVGGRRVEGGGRKGGGGGGGWEEGGRGWREGWEEGGRGWREEGGGGGRGGRKEGGGGRNCNGVSLKSFFL